MTDQLKHPEDSPSLDGTLPDTEAQAEYDTTPELRELLARAAASGTVRRPPLRIERSTEE